MNNQRFFLFAAFLFGSMLAHSNVAHARDRNFCNGSFSCGIPIVADPTISIPGHNVACGGDRQAACTSGALCDAGHAPINPELTSNFPFVLGCPVVDPSPPCTSPSTYAIPDETIETACYICGRATGDGTARLGCNLPAGQQCSAGLDLVRPTDPLLYGPISNCPSYLPPDPDDVVYAANTYTWSIPLPIVPDINIPISVPEIRRPMPTSEQIVGAAGICTPGTAENLNGASRESWPSEEAQRDGPQTVFVIHGRGGSCATSGSILNDAQAGGGGLLERNHLTYCIEYAQPDRMVRIMPVLQNDAEPGLSECAANGNCQFDTAQPVFEQQSATLRMPHVISAVAQGIKSVPISGDITLLAHSQGGFIARALMHDHYDDLRWHGRRVSSVLTLGHPYFAKEQDPQLYAPWLCFDDPGFDCSVGRWLMGWDNWLGSASGGSIDNGDFPQVRWTAVAGNGVAGDITVESNDGPECSMIFGGVDPATVVGDGSVPVQSSLGVDEFGFYPIDQIELDDSSQENACGHGATCLLRNRLAHSSDDIPFATPRVVGTGALLFDGVNQYVETTPSQHASFDLSGSNKMSLDFWVKPTRANSTGFIVSRFDQYQVFLGSGKVLYAIRNSSPGWFSRATNYTPPPGVWTHLALTYDGANVRLYANGVNVFSESSSGSIGQSAGEPVFQIGSRLNSQTFEGAIDEMRVWGRQLSSQEVALSITAPESVSNADLRGWWRFEESAGTQLDDSGPLQEHLSTLTDDPTTTPLRRLGARAFAQQGYAMYFDGVNDTVAITAPDALVALEADNALTLEAWVFPRSASIGGAIINKEGEYQLTRLADGQIAFTLASASPGWSTRPTGVMLPARQWSHVAMSFDGAVARVYLNGVEVYSEAAIGPIGDFPSHASQDELWIGGRQSNNSQWFRGAISEVRVWNTTRSASEIAAAHAAPLSGNETGLTGYWPFDDYTSDVAFDRSPTRAPGALGRSTPGARPVLARAEVFGDYPAAFTPDTDGDGLSDSDEILLYGTDPSVADSDADGLSDGVEVEAGMNPNSADTDGDGLFDQFEFDNALDPLDAGDATDDGDNDGLDNLAEQAAGTLPGVSDTDNDLANDGLEVNTLGTNPLVPDSDGDSVQDGSDNCALIANSDQRDTNADGYGNLCDADFDNNCIVNVVDLGLLRSVFFTSDPDVDLNGDGTVNVLDLGLFRAAFFEAPGPSAVGNACVD